MFDCLASAHGRSATGVWSGVTMGMHVRRVTVCTKHNDVSLLETSSEEVDSARSLDSADTQKHSRTFKGTKCTYQNTPKNHYNPKRKIHFGSGSQISCARRQTIKEPPDPPDPPAPQNSMLAPPDYHFRPYAGHASSRTYPNIEFWGSGGCLIVWRFWDCAHGI